MEDIFTTTWPGVQTAVDDDQLINPLEGDSDSTQTAESFDQVFMNPTVNFHEFSRDEAFNWGDTMTPTSWNWKPLLPHIAATATQTLGQHSVQEIQPTTFHYDNVYGAQNYAAAGYQSAGFDPHPTGFSDARTKSLWQPGSTSSFALPYGSPTSVATAFGFLAENATSSSYSPAIVPTKTKARKRRRRSSSNSDNIVSKKKPRVRSRKPLTECKSAPPLNPKYTTARRQQAEHLLGQIKQFLDKETSPMNPSTNTDNNIWPDIHHQPSSSALDVTDYTGHFSTGPEILFTPSQLVFASHGIASKEVEMPQSPTISKMYQCTFPDCYHSADSWVDWKRHESKEGHWPQERFMCLQCNKPKVDDEGNPKCAFCSIRFSILGDARTHYVQCLAAREEGKIFTRKDHLCKHLEVEHDRKDMAEATKTWSYPVHSDWPHECGFCGESFDNWEQRMRHVGNHYQRGSQKSEWILPFPRPKDHTRRENQTSSGHEDDDGGDDSNDKELSKIPSSYRNQSSPSRFGNRSSKPPPQTDSSHHTYNGRQQYDTMVTFSQYGRTLSNLESCSTRPGLTTFPLPHMSDLGPIRARWAREYINKHSGALPGAIFWFTSKLEVAVESSLWNIAFRVALSCRREGWDVLQTLRRLWHNNHQSPRLFCHPKWKLVPRHESSPLASRSSVVVALADGAHLTRPQHFGSTSQEGIDATIEESQAQSAIPQASLRCITQHEYHDQPPLLQELNFKHHTANNFDSTYSSQPSPQIQPPGQCGGGASHRRGPWSQAEDAYLTQLVHTQGALNWVRIAQLIGSRSPKQCRERYHQNLKPSLNHEPISPEEGSYIESMVEQFGKRWGEIARRLHGRSDNAVKNWWNGSMNRRRRLVLRKRSSVSHGSNYDEEPESIISFPRPHIGVKSPSGFSRTGADSGFPSPALSMVSRAESVDGTPSLISDNSSCFSMSPPLRPVSRHGIRLPPLNLLDADARNPSLTTLFSRASSLTIYEGNESSPSLPATAKVYFDQAAPLPSISKIYYDQASPSLSVCQAAKHRSMPSLRAANSGTHLPMGPPSICVPPLQSTDRSKQQGKRESDSRMHLSSLLS